MNTEANLARFEFNALLSMFFNITRNHLAFSHFKGTLFFSYLFSFFLYISIYSEKLDTFLSVTTCFFPYLSKNLNQLELYCG